MGVVRAWSQNQAHHDLGTMGSCIHMVLSPSDNINFQIAKLAMLHNSASDNVTTDQLLARLVKTILRYVNRTIVKCQPLVCGHVCQVW